MERFKDYTGESMVWVEEEVVEVLTDELHYHVRMLAGDRKGEIVAGYWGSSKGSSQVGMGESCQEDAISHTAGCHIGGVEVDIDR